MGARGHYRVVEDHKTIVRRVNQEACLVYLIEINLRA